MNYKKIMLVTFMLLAILTIGAVSATEDIASDELAASDEVADVQLPQEDFDDLSTDNSAMVYTHDDEVDEGEVGDGDDEEDPYRIEVVEEFDVSDQNQTIISIFCPEGTEGWFVIMVLDDDWREIFDY